MMGQRFTAGEPLFGVRQSNWETRRCGSVITSVIDGMSHYGLVENFVENPCLTDMQFAVMQWFACPHYPYENPCVTCLRDDDECHDSLPRLLSIFDIDPCGVCVERRESEKCTYVYRTHGLDTNPIFKF